jgi:hypothetical protein
MEDQAALAWLHLERLVAQASRAVGVEEGQSGSGGDPVRAAVGQRALFIYPQPVHRT